MIDAIEAVNSLMDELDLCYGLGEYDQSIEESNVYFVGEGSSIGGGEDNETGYILIEGWSLGEGSMPLLMVDVAIRRALGGDRRIKTLTGAVVLSYGGSQSIPSDIKGVHRNEITINYTEWSVNKWPR